MQATGRQRNHVILNDSDDLRNRQMRHDAGESYMAACSHARCGSRPDYHYSFEVHSSAHGDWQKREYFYCMSHMEAVARRKSLALPVLVVSGSPASSQSIYHCFSCSGHATRRHTRGRQFFVECSQCGARGPSERSPHLAVLRWNQVCTDRPAGKRSRKTGMRKFAQGKKTAEQPATRDVQVATASDASPNS